MLWQCGGMGYETRMDSCGFLITEPFVFLSELMQERGLRGYGCDFAIDSWMWMERMEER